MSAINIEKVAGIMAAQNQLDAVVIITCKLNHRVDPLTRRSKSRMKVYAATGQNAPEGLAAGIAERFLESFDRGILEMKREQEGRN